jgi:tetratricopeptide (TPR) repeat protein
VALSLGEPAQAEAYLQESLALARKQGDRPAIAAALNGLGNNAAQQAAYAPAIRFYLEARELGLALDDRYLATISSGNIAECQLSLKDYAAAAHWGQAMLESARAIGADSVAATALLYMGEAALGLGQAEAARNSLNESLRLASAIGDMVHMIEALTGYANLLGQTGQPARALELLGLALAHPATSANTRHQVNLILADLRDGKYLEGLDVDAALARGAQLDLVTVARELPGEA